MTPCHRLAWMVTLAVHCAGVGVNYGMCHYADPVALTACRSSAEE